MNLWVIRCAYVAITSLFIGGWVVTYRTLQPGAPFPAFNRVSTLVAASGGEPGAIATVVPIGYVASDGSGGSAPVSGIAGVTTADPSPTATARATPEPSATPTPAGATYIIKSGDTLGAIAKAHGETVERLATANHLTPPYVLRAGDRLLIPAH